jgi:hypothetical protein
MPKLVAIYGSPRRKGNTTALLKIAVEGARNNGALVEEFVLRVYKCSKVPKFEKLRESENESTIRTDSIGKTTGVFETARKMFPEVFRLQFCKPVRLGGRVRSFLGMAG